MSPGPSHGIWGSEEEQPAVCYTLTTNILPANSGTIEASAQNCAGGYTAGTVVQLTATPNEGYQFDIWSGDVTNTADPIDVTVTGNMAITANFTVDTFTLNYTAGTGGSLTGDTAQVVNYGEDGTAVTAVPDLGYHFVDWSDGSTLNPRTDTNVTANKSVTANFALTNAAPVANNDNYETDEDTPLSVAAPGVLSNDIDTDPLTAMQVSDPLHGTLAFNANGSFTYTPYANYNGADSFTYKTNDGALDSNVATVNITINEVSVILGDPLGTLTNWDHSFNWTGFRDATWYHLEVQTASGGPVLNYWYTSAETGCAGGTTCVVSPPETLNLGNGDYQWRIQDYGATGYGSWTGYQDFTLNISSAPVVLGDPVGTLTSWDHSFHWTGIPGATWYLLEVQTASGTPLHIQWYPAEGNCVALACSLTPAEMMTLGNGAYKWRISDYGVYGYGSWTAFRDFTLNLGPTVAVLAQPSGTLTSWDGSFHWTGIEGASWYRLEVQDAGGGTLLNAWYSAADNCATLACAVTAGLSLGNGVYHWRVQDYGAYGFGTDTALQDFTLEIAPKSAVLGQPAGTLTSWDHKFYWTGVSGASWYHLEVQDGVGSTVVSQWYAADASCVGLDCALTPAETANLGNGNYQWRIQDYGSYGYGTQTGWQSFTLDIFTGTVVLGQPSGSLTSWDGSFHWTGIPSATWYHLEVQDGNGTTLLSPWYSVGTACVALDCAVTPDGAASLPGGDYQWRVQYFSPTSGYGDWTALQGFTLNLGPVNLVLGQPSGSLTSWDGSFHWTGIPSATWYHLEVQDGSGTTLLNTWYSVGTTCTGSTCAVTPDETLALPDGDYQWRIQDYGSNGYGSWTQFQTFTLNR